jgi:hypothetical protein
MNIISGFSDPQRRYEDMDLTERAIRVDAWGVRPPLPKVDLKKYLPKEAAETLRAFVEDFRDQQNNLEQLSVSQVQQWYDIAKKAAAQAENALLAPANTAETKNRLRTTRREISAQFKSKWFVQYNEAMRAALAAVVGPLEKLIVSEDAEDAKQLKAYGLAQTSPCPIVASLLALRNYLKNRVEFYMNAQAEVNSFATLHPDLDLMRLLGVEI